MNDLSSQEEPLVSPATTKSRNSGMAHLSLLLILVACIWHLAEAYSAGLGMKDHISATVFSLLFGILGIFIILPGKGELMDYLNILLDRERHRLVGLSAVIIGGMHFLTFSKATDVVPMFGFVIILLAYYELGSLAIRTTPYLALDDANESTQRFIRYSAGKVFVALGLTLAMSTFMLFISFIYLF